MVSLELISTLKELSQANKVRVMQVLFSELINQEKDLVKPDNTNPIWSPYNAIEAAAKIENDAESDSQLSSDSNARLAKLKEFIAERNRQQPSPEAAEYFERFKEYFDAEREPQRKLFH